jgi:hypothetical protein
LPKFRGSKSGMSGVLILSPNGMPSGIKLMKARVALCVCKN